MKSIQAVIRAIENRLSSKWHTQLTGEDAFPWQYPLGRVQSSALLNDYAAVHEWTVEWQEWSQATGTQLSFENRVAQGRTLQSVPTHLHIDTIDRAAQIVSGEWPERIGRGRDRIRILTERFPNIENLAGLLRVIDRYEQVDFELLMTVGDWYLEDPSRAALGVTPRQVPIPGVHAKWLQNHRAGVQALTGIQDLGLLPAHPSRIHFTYLDPNHRASGKRIHDSATVGDSYEPVYRPTVVIISENKDTAIHFPELRDAISIEGVGRGGKTLASFPWIREAPIVIYWGDMDRDGYEILDGYRQDFDRDIDSILMDPAAYAQYERYGTSTDRFGKELQAGAPRPVPALREPELQVYLTIIAAEHGGYRRIEQERIPLDHALAEVERIVKDRTPPLNG